MLWLVLLKIRLTFIALANRLAYVTVRIILTEYKALSPYLVRYFFLILTREIDEVVIFSAHQKRDSRLIETSTLTIPLFNRVQCTFPGEIKHEQYCYRVVANKRQHIDKFSLASQIPY